MPWIIAWEDMGYRAVREGWVLERNKASKNSQETPRNERTTIVKIRCKIQIREIQIIKKWR